MLAGYRQPERMFALSDADVAALRLSVLEAPAAMAPGEVVFVRVRLENDTAETLGSWPPFPLHWACLWRPVDAVEFGPEASARTLIRRAVSPGRADEFAVRVVAPAIPGRYVARLTLVQDGLRWLDQTATPVCADVEVIVRREPA
jgi:hypothetical protein